MLTVTLTSCGNPDFGQVPAIPVSPSLEAEVANIDEAIERCRAYIDEHDLGGGNWTGGQVYLHPSTSCKSFVGRISYNGRWWPVNPDKAASFVEAMAGRPGVVFTCLNFDVQALTIRLSAAGYRVIDIPSDASPATIRDRLQKFQPESGEPTIDILVASNVLATGVNLNRAEWLLHYDDPDATIRGQRNARISRSGRGDGPVIADLARWKDTVPAGTGAAGETRQD